MTFDKIGKTIIQEIRPYMLDYPFAIINLEVETDPNVDFLRVTLLCKECGAETKAKMLPYKSNPFLNGMTMTRIFYEHHGELQHNRVVKTALKEEPPIGNDQFTILPNEKVISFHGDYLITEHEGIQYVVERINFLHTSRMESRRITKQVWDDAWTEIKDRKKDDKP